MRLLYCSHFAFSLHSLPYSGFTLLVAIIVSSSPFPSLQSIELCRDSRLLKRKSIKSYEEGRAWRVSSKGKGREIWAPTGVRGQQQGPSSLGWPLRCCTDGTLREAGPLRTVLPIHIFKCLHAVITSPAKTPASLDAVSSTNSKTQI